MTTGLESFVGEQVTLLLSNGETLPPLTLDGIGDRGLLLSHNNRRAFIQWHAFSAVFCTRENSDNGVLDEVSELLAGLGRQH